MYTKKELRKRMLERRASLDPKERERWDEEIYKHVLKSSFYKRARVIFAFVTFKGEVDTKSIIASALEDKKIVCIPKILSKEQGMDFFQIKSLSDLVEGYYGILEVKDPGEAFSSEEIDLMFIPGLAFDKKGGRLGMGAGFYDRYIEKSKGCYPKIALAYDFQILEEVPMEEHDRRIQGIISNREIIDVTEESLEP